MMSVRRPDRTRPEESPHDPNPTDTLGTKAGDQSGGFPLSIVVPVFGSESTLRELCQRIAAAVSPIVSRFEVILVDDSSNDASWSVIQEICAGDDRIVGVHLSANLGQQRATLRGLSLARGRMLVTIDDDLQQPPEDIPLLYQALEERDLDAAFGSFPVRHHAWYRNFGSAVVMRITRHVLGVSQSLQMTSFRAMRAEVAHEVLRVQGPNPFIGQLVLKTAREVINVDVGHGSRVSGRSGYTLSKLLDLTFSMIFDAHPRAYSTGKWLGFLMLLFGIFLGFPSFEGSRLIAWAVDALRVLVIAAGLLLVSLKSIRKRVAPLKLSQRSAITMEILRGNERFFIDARLPSEEA